MSYPIFFCIIFCWGSIHDHRLRLLPTVHYFFSIISKIYLQPQHNAENPLAVLPLLRPRLILPFLHLSPIAGIRGAAADICPPQRSPPSIYIQYPPETSSVRTEEISLTSSRRTNQELPAPASTHTQNAATVGSDKIRLDPGL